MLLPNIIDLRAAATSMKCDFIWGEPIKKKRRVHKQYTYTHTYPTDAIKDMKFESSEQISAFLLRNAEEIGYCKWQLFEKTTNDMGKYIRIVYSCRVPHCDAELVYNQKKTEWQSFQIGSDGYPRKYYLSCTKSSNTHNHPLKITRKLASQQSIRQYLFDLPVQQKFENHVQVVKDRFKLTRCQAKYLKDRVFWRFKDEDHMLRKLSERKASFRRKIQNGKSSILLLVSQTMVKNYHRYGDILCFDITYKLLMRKKDQSKHLGVGFFIGQDQNSRIIVFGVSTIQHESAQNFMILFEFFFQIMGHVPRSILTDDQRALGYAIQRLKKQKNYEFVHLLDWYHKIQSIKRLTKRQKYRDQLFTLFCRILKEPSQQIYADIVFEIATLLERPATMVDFLRERERCCLSQVPPAFFAFGISSTRAQAFNGLIKRSVPHQTNIGRLIYFVLRIQKRLNNRMSVLNYIHPQLLTHINNPELLTLSSHLQHFAFQQLRQYYQQSRQFQSPQSGPSPNTLWIRFRKYERSYRYCLMYDLSAGCWRCECKNNFRTGMPCAHVVRVVREFEGVIGYYVNERWLHCKDDVQVRKPTRPNTRNKRI